MNGRWSWSCSWGERCGSGRDLLSRGRRVVWCRFWCWQQATTARRSSRLATHCKLFSGWHCSHGQRARLLASSTTCRSQLLHINHSDLGRGMRMGGVIYLETRKPLCCFRWGSGHRGWSLKTSCWNLARRLFCYGTSSMVRHESGGLLFGRISLSRTRYTQWPNVIDRSVWLLHAVASLYGI